MLICRLIMDGENDRGSGSAGSDTEQRPSKQPSGIKIRAIFSQTKNPQALIQACGSVCPAGFEPVAFRVGV